MKIRKLSATFGKLKNAKLELGDGLNIISAPNEYGKSTWCGFINAMLYGVDTSERDKAGYLSTKTRYRPWDGGAMVGTAELEAGGREITVQRTARGSSPMKNFIAVKTGTAEFLRDLTGETAGEALTGVTRGVFERTAFIRRADIRVNQTADLEKKIADIVSTGDESTSYSGSAALLGRWQRKLRYNKSGTLPAMEQELAAQRRALEKIHESSEEAAGLRSTMSRLEKQLDMMRQDLVIHDKLDKRAAARRLKEAKHSAETAEEDVRRLTAAVTKNGKRMTREDITSIRETAAAVMPLKKVANDAERALWRAEKELVDADARRSASPLHGRDDGKLSEDIQKGRELERKAREKKDPKIPKFIPIILCVLAVLGLVLTTGLLEPALKNIPGTAGLFEFDLIGVAASLAIGAAGLVLFFVKPRRRRSPEDDLRELLDGYGVPSVEKLASLREAYKALTADEDRLRAARDAARSAYESAGTAAQEAGERAVRELSAFMPEISSGEAVLDALNETEREIDELTRAEFDAVAARNVYETLLAEYDPSEEPDDTFLPTPMRSREDTLAAIERINAQLSAATRDYDLASGGQRTLGDPAVIEGRIRELEERIEADNRRYSALTLAIDTLAEANTQLQTRFSPEVSRRAGEILSRLTGGKYERLYFDKGFDASAKEEDGVEAHNVLTLSDGTGDEIYLSLRLAMCELILGGDDPCPIILDDALANFDDARCRRALELLAELSEKRQIILFTCHTREADMLSARPGVNIIREQ